MKKKSIQILSLYEVEKGRIRRSGPWAIRRLLLHAAAQNVSHLQAVKDHLGMLSITLCLVSLIPIFLLIVTTSLHHQTDNGSLFGLIVSGSVKFAGDQTVLHNDNTGAHAQILVDGVAQNDNALTGIGHIADQVVDFNLSANVNTTGGVVQDDDLSLGGQSTGENDLLLVTFREVLSCIRYFGIQPTDSVQAYEDLLARKVLKKGIIKF